MELEGINKEMLILVADDHSLTRDMIRLILKQIGFTNLVTADDGAKALARIEEGGIELVICDWNMPKLSGLQVLEKVRREERHKTLPFLMLTAEAYRENVTAALSTGVTDYIAKPFTADTLIAKIKTACK